MNRTALEFRLDHYLGCVANHIPQALVPNASLKTIREFASTIPGDVTSFFGFECPLSATLHHADFLICSTRLEGHSRILAGRHPKLALPEALFEHPAWRSVRAFCREWECDRSELHEALFNIWLEFDVDQNRQNRLFTPNIFFGTQPPALDDVHRRQEASTFVRLAAGHLLPDATVGARGELLDRLFASLPGDSYVFQVGAMLARPAAAIRICIRGFEVSSIVDFLLTLGWSGGCSSLSAVLAELSPLADRIDLDLDLDEAVGSKIGMECYLVAESGDNQRLRSFVSYLVERNLCSVEKAEALLGYQGIDLQDAAPTSWPAYLHKGAALRGDDVASLMHRWVHHIKVVHQLDQPLSAKAYLAAEHHFISRAAIRSAAESALGN